MKILQKLKQRWEIESNFQLILILIAFSITGSVAAWISKPFVEWLGIGKDSMPSWLFLIVRLILIFPVYSIILLIIGSLLGQFKFFWAFEKKMFSRFIPKKYSSR